MTGAEVPEIGTQIPSIEIPRRDQEHLDSLVAWVFTNTGMNYPRKKRGILYSRLQSLCWRLGISGIQEMDRLLQEDGSDWLAAEVARAAATNYTFFFRERETLDFFRRHILSSLPAAETWRIWSAASASGEEVYSIAILLAEALGLGQAQSRAALLGTDISYPMIDQAERGIYTKERVDALPQDMLHRYLEPAGPGKWRVGDSMRGMCTFRRMNLMAVPWPFRRSFQVIFCRNIFYYFDRQQQLELVDRLYDAAAPGGWLLTSVTETFHSMPIRWRRISAGVWRK